MRIASLLVLLVLAVSMVVVAGVETGNGAAAPSVVLAAGETGNGAFVRGSEFGNG